MKKSRVTSQVLRYGAKRMKEIYAHLLKDNLWKRMVKNIIATTVAVSICLIPGEPLGKAGYLAAITTVFGHPGRRFGMMAEALILTLAGTLLGMAWSVLGIYLGSLVHGRSPSAGYAIRGIFLAVALLFHGFVRSATPRLFILVLLLIIVSVVSLTSTTVAVTPTLTTQILYPILMAAGVILLVNICIFPEFSSSFLGQSAIETLNDTAHALENVGQYFVRDSPSSSHDTTERSGPHQAATVYSLEKDKKLIHDNDVQRGVRNSLPLVDVFRGEDGSASVNSGTSTASKEITISDLTAAKTKLRSKLGSCKAVLKESNFELAWSVLPPRDMKPISDKLMKQLVANTIALTGACESKYALLGDVSAEEKSKSDESPGTQENPAGDHDTGNGVPGNSLNEGSPASPSAIESSLGDHPEKLSKSARKQRRKSRQISHDKAELDMIKPKREIESGDVILLQYLLRQIANPWGDLQAVIARTVDIVSACVAFAYDVPKLPSGVRVPKGFLIEELDMHIETLKQALVDFDADTSSALERAAGQNDLQDHELDIMPREEVFLVSSFLLNLRQAAFHLLDMLKHSRELVERHQDRHGRRRIYSPRINWSNWLSTGNQEEEALPASGRQAARQGASDEQADEDEENEILIRNKTKGDLERDAGIDGQRAYERSVALKSEKDKCKSGAAPEPMSLSLRIRGRLADVLEWAQESDDLQYAIKLSVAVFLVTWPAFIAKWNTWYSLNRGLWAALQLVLITEVAIGNSVKTFIIRGIGTTLGCLWGWAAYEARNGDRIVCVAMICIGLFPAVYVQLGTKYPKAGMVCIVSMGVVALSTELRTVPGTATENFWKRFIAFMIGGMVALIVEVAFLPVKARSRLVESLAAALRHINEMEGYIAHGIEDGVNLDVDAPGIMLRFESASAKAKGSLTAAETFLPFCSNEPRLKGSFEGLALIYGEVLFVLHEIIERMDNMLHLRTAYGSGPLEEFNAQIYTYRRNVAGSITIIIFAIHEALTTKLPLPQFLPSARLAHLRMVNRVREVVQASAASAKECQEGNEQGRQRAVRRKYISWNAAAFAQAEVIEFLEELIELTKLLVGNNEFRSGLLVRPTYRDYAGPVSTGESKENSPEKQGAEDAETLDGLNDMPSVPGLTKRRTGTMKSTHEDEGEVPVSLKRIHSRKRAESFRKLDTNSS